MYGGPFKRNDLKRNSLYSPDSRWPGCLGKGSDPGLRTRSTTQETDA